MNTKTQVMDIARKQLALDYNCKVSDFNKIENIVTENKILEGSRYDERDCCFLKIMTIGGRSIISADKEIMPWIDENILKENASWLFDYGNLRSIDNKLKEFGHEIDEMYNFYLPNPKRCDVKPITKIKWFEQDEILKFKGDSRFEQAFYFDENHPDMLGVAAINGDTIMGMAGASRDSENLYQIGIDVLPQYAGKGIGTNLVTLIKQELLKRGKIPFYGTSVSHIISRNIAINAGFFPAWAEVHSRKRKV